MSGAGSGSQQQTQNQQTNPWAPAIPELQHLLTGIQGVNMNPSAGQQTAAENLVSGANSIPNLGPNVANTISGYLNPNFTNPYSNPAFSGAMSELLRQAQLGIGSEFAGAGRDPSGNAQAPEAIARGFAQGAAPALANQYDALLQAQQNGIGSIPSIAEAYLNPGQAQLGAATTQAQLPLANILGLEQSTIPIAGLGGQSQGQMSGTYTPSLLSDIYGGINAASGMFGAYNYGQPRSR